MNQLGTILFCLVCTVSSAWSQAILKQFIRNNAVTIKSIAVSDTNYDDLIPLGKAIGEARVVMLGEQDHGDAPTFMAKARLVKYLHQKHGFKLLAFESDFFGLTQGYDQMVKEGTSMDTFLDQNLFAMWTNCQQFSGMADYITGSHRSANRLIIAGIDNQLHGEYTKGNFTKELNRFLTSSQIPFIASRQYRDIFLPLVDTILYYSGRQQTYNDNGKINLLLSYLDTILVQLKETSPQTDFWPAAIENFRSVCRSQILRKSGNFSDSFVERDKQMSANLTWLLKVKYPNEKVIVWAANGHIIKNALNAVEPQKFRHPSLGNYFNQQPEFTDRTYVLGFTSYQGSAGRTTAANSIYSFPPPAENSFEQWISAEDRDYGFVDFKQFNQINPGFNTMFYMNGESHYQQKGVWTKTFDGMFFIKNMYPCEKLK